MYDDDGGEVYVVGDDIADYVVYADYVAGGDADDCDDDKTIWVKIQLKYEISQTETLYTFIPVHACIKY